MNKKKILIFDDDKTLLDVLTMVFFEEGYDVEISETSHDIIERVSTFSPDLILMDNYIPEIGGTEAIKLLRTHEQFDHIPVIIISASIHIVALKNASKANDYLRKPFDLYELEQLIARYLK
jgi:CheY-like chemotaxis protein